MKIFVNLTESQINEIIQIIILKFCLISIYISKNKRVKKSFYQTKLLYIFFEFIIKRF